VGRSGFEPLKSKDSGFTVRPIWPLWNLPEIILKFWNCEILKFPNHTFQNFSEPLVGIEPTTY
jgi:hypothetical protein